MKVDKKINQIILSELGKNSSKQFIMFYDGFSYEEQLNGARELLNLIIGPKRTDLLLKDL